MNKFLNGHCHDFGPILYSYYYCLQCLSYAYLVINIQLIVSRTVKSKIQISLFKLHVISLRHLFNIPVKVPFQTDFLYANSF